MTEEEKNSNEEEVLETAPAEEGSSEMDDLKAELEKAKNEHLYLRAEFENYKKNMIKERADYLKYGSERIIVSLLEVLDNFNRALDVQLDAEKPESIESFKKGMELTASEFKSTLKKFGVEEIECAGKPFDPNIHEALSSLESNDVDPGHVLQVFKSAYKLHDRVIRPAQVVVAKEAD